MQRLIVTPPVLPAAALAELKDWLGITTAIDDAPLPALLPAALELCEDFTGRMPLAATCEEMLCIAGGWQRLSTRPVQAIILVEGIPAEGPRFALAPGACELDLDADGGGLVRVLSPGIAGRRSSTCSSITSRPASSSALARCRISSCAGATR